MRSMKRKEENSGKRDHICFMMTMLQLIMPHDDNAPAHNALGIREFLAKNNIAVLEPPTYNSPDLAPCDFFLFPKLKEVIKGSRFQNSEAIKSAVTREL